MLLIVGVSFPAIWSTLRASRLLFNSMLESVMRSPPRFFDKTPAGRILNRFTKGEPGICDIAIAKLSQTSVTLTAEWVAPCVMSAAWH